jgi:hypothetical protein
MNGFMTSSTPFNSEGIYQVKHKDGMLSITDLPWVFKAN